MTKSFKSFIILIVSGLSFNSVSAQHDNSFVGLRFGGALPLGEFSSHEFGYGGYALLGKCYGIEGAWYINPKIGFGIDISTNSFGFASGYYIEDYIETEPSFSGIDMLSGPYKVNTYMGGAYYKVSISNKFYSTFKLMGGIFKAWTPDQLYSANAFIAGNLTFWKTGTYDTEFTFLTGASFEYKLYDHVTLVLQADFTYAQPGFVYTRGDTSYTDYLRMPVFQLEPGINISF